jgi:hypothetical protein
MELFANQASEGSWVWVLERGKPQIFQNLARSGIAPDAVPIFGEVPVFINGRARDRGPFLTI